MQSGPLRRALVWAVVVIAAACGGKAIVDGKSSGGAGGSGGTAAMSSAVTSAGGVFDGQGPMSVTVAPSASSVMTDATTGPPPDACGQACMASAPCFNQPADCTAQCDNAGCSALHQQLLQCSLQNGLGKCTSMPCSNAVVAYRNCKGWSSSKCNVGAGGNCSCDDVVGGHKYTTQCMPGNAVSFCVCQIDGVGLGKCTAGFDTNTACQLPNSCCGPLFFVAH